VDIIRCYPIVSVLKASHTSPDRDHAPRDEATDQVRELTTPHLPTRLIPALNRVQNRENEDRRQLGIGVGSERPFVDPISDDGTKCLLIVVPGRDHSRPMYVVEHPCLVEKRPDDVLVVENHVDMPDDQRPQSIVRRPLDLKGPCRRILKETCSLFNNLDQEVLLRVDMGVER